MGARDFIENIFDKFQQFIATHTIRNILHNGGMLFIYTESYLVHDNDVLFAFLHEEEVAVVAVVVVVEAGQ